jgi:hypothetical protein
LAVVLTVVGRRPLIKKKLKNNLQNKLNSKYFLRKIDCSFDSVLFAYHLPINIFRKIDCGFDSVLFAYHLTLFFLVKLTVVLTVVFSVGIPNAHIQKKNCYKFVTIR